MCTLQPLQTRQQHNEKQQSAIQDPSLQFVDRPSLQSVDQVGELPAEPSQPIDQLGVWPSVPLQQSAIQGHSLEFVDRPLLQSIDQPGDGPAEPFQQSNIQDRSLQCASHQSVEQSGSLPATDQSSLHVSELLEFSAELSFPDMSVNLDLQTSFTFSDISTTKSRLTSTPVQLSMPSSGLDLLTSEATMQQLDVVSKAIPGPFSLMLEEADCQWQHCSQAKGDATGFQQFTAHQQIAGSLLQTMNNCQQTAASTKTINMLYPSPGSVCSCVTTSSSHCRAIKDCNH